VCLVQAGSISRRLFGDCEVCGSVVEVWWKVLKQGDPDEPMYETDGLEEFFLDLPKVHCIRSQRTMFWSTHQWEAQFRDYSSAFWRWDG
jgi:hypothetical protein